MKAAFKKVSSPQSKDEDLNNGLATDVPGVGAVIGGTYYALDKIPSSLERQLDREGLLFDSCSDPIKVSANMCSHWPKGEDNKHEVQKLKSPTLKQRVPPQAGEFSLLAPLHMWSATTGPRKRTSVSFGSTSANTCA